MKGSEFVKLLLEKVGVDNDEINAFATAGALQEVEISDEAAEVVGKAEVFNAESARNNPELAKYFRSKMYPEVKGELLDRVDQKINRVAKQLLKDEQINQLNEIEYTQDRVEKLGEMLTGLIEEKTDDSKAKETIAKYRQQVEELNKAIEERETGFKQELTKREQEFKNNLLKRDVYTLTSDFPLQEAFTATEEIKNSIKDIVWNKLNEVATPKYNESGKIELYQKEDPEMLLYDGNKKVDVRSLIEKAISPYTKKSDPAPKRDNDPRPSQPSNSTAEIKDPMLLDRLRKVGQL